jgi:hypothetical protein
LRARANKVRTDLTTFRRKNDLVEIRRAGAPNIIDPPVRGS